MLALLLIFKLCQAGHIYSWDPTLSYNMQGTLSTLSIPFKLESAIQNGSSYLHFGGVTLHSLTPSEVYADVLFNNGSILVTQLQASNQPPATYLNDYFFGITGGLPSDQWLTLVLYATNSVPGLAASPYGLRTISSLNQQALVYDENMQAGHVNVAALPQSGLTIAFSVDVVAYPNYLNPGAIYEMNVDITPRISLSGFSLLTQITMEYHTEGLYANDFFFQVPTNSSGCSSQDIPELKIKAFGVYTCTVDSTAGQFMTLTSQEQLVANQKVRIRVNVQNPPFVSVRDLRTISIAINQGDVITEKGWRTNVLSVVPIVVQTTSLKYLWGIDALDVLPLSVVNLWSADNPAQAAGPYNAIQVRFVVLQQSPKAFPHNVRVKLSCTHALASNTYHNFQAFNATLPIYCAYTTPYMVCYNVAALVPLVTYFLSTKVYFAAPTQIQDFGAVDTQIVSPVALRTIQVYLPSLGFYQNVVSESNLYDIGGWHGPNGGLSYTQVSSIGGSTLSQATLSGVLGAQGSVGIFPSGGSPTSSLLFFLRTTSQQQCGPSTLLTDVCGPTTIGTKYLKMTIMMNSDVLTSDRTNLPKGLSYVASDGAGGYAASKLACLTAGYCDQPGQNTYAIINQNALSGSYGVASFECGVLTQPGNVVVQCNYLQGAVTSTLGSGAVMSLPGVTWKPSFVHSSQYADETLLDFVVTLYEGDLSASGKPVVYTPVSSHLINGYTVDNVIPSNLQVSFVNYYASATVPNDGWIVPTLMRLRGTLTQADLTLSDRVTVFFDQQPNFFAQGNNYSCSSGGACLAFQVVVPGIMDQWQHQSGVDVPLNNLTTFDVVFPITPLALPRTIYIVLQRALNTTLNNLRSAPRKVYRMYGAAIQGNTLAPIAVINTLQAQPTLLTFPYVKAGSGTIFDFGVDVTSISATSATSTLRFTTTQSDVQLQSSGGAGLTLTSTNQNLFNRSSVQLGSIRCLPSFTVTRTLTTLSATQDVNFNLPRYTLFCAFDVPPSYPLTMSVQTSTTWPLNYNLQTSLSYGISGSAGQLFAAVRDSGVVQRLLNKCTMGATNAIYANSLGRQRILIPVQLVGNFTLGVGAYPQITMEYALQASIVGFEMQTSTTVCYLQMANPQLPVSCVYVWNSGQAKATITVVPLDPTKATLIPANQNITIIMPLNPTYGLSQFGGNQPSTFTIYVPTQDQATGKFGVYGNTYSTPRAIQEQCTWAAGVNLSTTPLLGLFTLQNLTFDVPNQYASTILSFAFGVGSYREYVPADTTRLKFELGFMRDPNSLPNLLACGVFDGVTNLSSQLWSYLDVSVGGVLQLYLKADLTAPNNYTFVMRCQNARTPGPANQSLGFVATWIEQSGLVSVQTSNTLSYANYAIQPLFAGVQVPPILSTKTLNSPGYGAVYTLTITNGAFRILYTNRLYVRMHTTLPPKLNRLGSVTCLLNGRSCYCEVSQRTVKVWPSVNVEAYAPFNLTLSQVEQPSVSRWPLSAYLWVGIDQDDDLSNGVYFSNFTSDVCPYQDPVSAITMLFMDMSGQYIRTEQTHTMQVLVASSTMTANNRMFVQFPEFYIESLQLKTANTAYNVTQIGCSLVRQGDPLVVNFATQCDVVSGTLVRVLLAQDNMNNFQRVYTLTLTNVPLPRRAVPIMPLNQFVLRVHVTDPTELKVKFTTALYTSDPLSFVAEQAQEVHWSGSYFSYGRSDNLNVTHCESAQPGITIWQGVFKTMMQLTGANRSIFSSTFGYQFLASDSKYFLTTYPTTLTANSGDAASQFLMATKSNLQPGYYVFPVQKLAGGIGYVNSLPYVQLFVVAQQCQLLTSKTSYTIPLLGISEPIIINIEDCFPTQDIRLSLTNATMSSGLVNELPNPQSIIYTQSSTVSVQGTLYFKLYQFIFIFRHTQSYQAIAGDTLNLAFKVDGQNQARYVAPPPITLLFTDAKKLASKLSAGFTTKPQTLNNTITMYFNCSDAAYLYWVIGVGGDISYIPWMEVRNRTLYQNNDRTHPDPNDPQWRVYGTRWMTNKSTEVAEYFTNLKQNDTYTLVAYCVNQMGLVSPQFRYDWKTPSNGGQTIKLVVTSNSPFSPILQSALVCAMNSIFPINPVRIFNQISQICDVSTINQITTGQVQKSRRALQQSTFYTQGAIIGPRPLLQNFIYLYSDQSLSNETLTQQILTQFKNTTTFIALLSANMNLDPILDPLITNVSYVFPTLNVRPTFLHTEPEVSSDAVRINFTLKGVNGFVGVGIEQTDTSPNPTILQLRRQTNYLNRPLLQSQLLFFNQTTQNALGGQTQVVIFQNLAPNLRYKIYWFSSNDDPGPLSLTTPVNSTVILTKPVPRIIYATTVSSVCTVILLIMIG